MGWQRTVRKYTTFHMLSSFHFVVVCDAAFEVAVPRQYFDILQVCGF